MTKRCWPWSHNWTVWRLADGFQGNRLTGQEIDTKVNVRSCKNCGITQVRGT